MPAGKCPCRCLLQRHGLSSRGRENLRVSIVWPGTAISGVRGGRVQGAHVGPSSIQRPAGRIGLKTDGGAEGLARAAHERVHVHLQI